MLWICNECSTGYSVGAPKCPQCGKNDHRDQGEPKPKAKKGAGGNEQSESADG